MSKDKQEVKEDVKSEKYTPKHLKEAEQWAKDACDRIFSHYSEQELYEMRLRNEEICLKQK